MALLVRVVSCDLVDRALGMSAALLLVVTAEIQLTFILNQAEPHLIEPAASAQHVAGEAFMRREINSHVERVAERFQSNCVAVSIEAAHRCAEAKRHTRLDGQTKSFSITALKHAERRAGVELGRKADSPFAKAECNRDLDALFVCAVVV